jgi:radical SAM protein with 4Fe4S-binding SPASM domain
MNVQDLKADLEKDYKLVLFADFADVSHSPTAAYKLLESVRKDVFADNERIVFYGNYPDIDLVNHVARARELLDIGEFFCIWQNQIEDALVPGTGYKLADTVCPLLWSHLEIRHNGDVYPCCVNKTPVGNVNEGSLVDIFNNDRMTLLRNQLSTGGRPDSCDHCWSLEKQGLSSNRQWHIGTGIRDFYSRRYDDIKIRSLDLKPSNTCNFKCRTCNPNNSSLIAAEATQHSSLPLGINRWDGYREYTWQELDTLLPTIENLDFFGGEPFLLKELKHFLQTAVDTGHCNHIRLHFNTNGSIYPESIINNIQKFNEVDIAVSIDDVGSRFELTRGGAWTEVESNILKLKSFESDCFKVYIFPTINVHNVLYLDELTAWADLHQIEYKFNFLEIPHYFNIDYLTDAAKELVVSKYKDSTNPLLQKIAERVKNSAGSNGRQFIKQTRWIDYIRNQDFSSTHKEIAQAMGYNLSSTN